MDSHLQHVLVDHNFCIFSVGMLSWNVPNTYKRCIESADTNVKGVQEPPHDSGGSSSWAVLLVVIPIGELANSMIVQMMHTLM